MRCKTCSKESIEFITTDGYLLFVCFCPGKTVIEKKESIQIKTNLEEYKKKEIGKLNTHKEKLEKELESSVKALKKLVDTDNFEKVPGVQENIANIRDNLEIIYERLLDFGS
jgi:hypothetical protein